MRLRLRSGSRIKPPPAGRLAPPAAGLPSADLHHHVTDTPPVDIIGCLLDGAADCSTQAHDRLGKTCVALVQADAIPVLALQCEPCCTAIARCPYQPGCVACPAGEPGVRTGSGCVQREASHLRTSPPFFHTRGPNSGACASQPQPEMKDTAAMTAKRLTLELQKIQPHLCRLL